MRIEIEEYVPPTKSDGSLVKNKFLFPPIPWKWTVFNKRGSILTYGYCHTEEDAIRMSQDACKN